MKLKTLVPEGIFRDRTSLYPYQWDEFKKNFLKKNKGTKSLISKKDNTEYLIHKDDPKTALVKYQADDMEVFHDMKRRDFFDYIR